MTELARSVEVPYTIGMRICGIPSMQEWVPGYRERLGLWHQVSTGLEFVPWPHRNLLVADEPGAAEFEAWDRYGLELQLYGIAVPALSPGNVDQLRVGWNLVVEAGVDEAIRNAYATTVGWPWTRDEYGREFKAWLDAWTEQHMQQVVRSLNLPRTLGGSLGRRLANQVISAPNLWNIGGADKVLVLNTTAQWIEKAQRMLTQKPRENAEAWTVRIRDLGENTIGISVFDDSGLDVRYQVMQRWAAYWLPWAQLEDYTEVVVSDDVLGIFWEEELPRLYRIGATVQIPKHWVRHQLVARPSLEAGWRPHSLDTRQWLDVEWDVLLDGMPMTEDMLVALAKAEAPRIKIQQQWVVVDDALVRRAKTLLRTIHRRHQSLGALYFRELMAERYDPSLVPEIRRRVSEVLADSPKVDMDAAGFRGVLPAYQKVGVEWLRGRMEHELGALLADDMGLGKTIEVIAAVLDFWRGHPGRMGPILVVCPLSVSTNWVKEWKRFTRDLPAKLYRGTRRVFAVKSDERDVIITTFDTVVRDHKQMAKVAWEGLIIDEAQHVKNRHTQRAQALATLNTRWRVALTGTPVENRLLDLWAIMDLLNPGCLGSSKDFQQYFERPMSRGAEEERKNVAEELTRALAPFVLRRTKTDPEIRKDLPDKLEVTEWVNLEPEQVVLYRGIVDQLLEELEQGESMEAMTRRGIVLRAITALKQIVNHPAQYLHEAEANPRRSGKLMRLDELLAQCVLRGEKSVVFTQYVRMARLLHGYAKTRYGVPVDIYHGGLAAGMRTGVVDIFNESPAPRILIASLKAGGVGLNLQSASQVFHYDRWWNPAIEDQATDRVWRLGQNKPVTSYKLVSRGTIEERIDELIHQKHYLTSLIMEPMAQRPITEWNTHELREWMSLGERYEIVKP